MTPERWQQVKEVVADAAALPGEERPAWLAARCAGDPELRQEVESLLAHEDDGLELLTSPLGNAVRMLALDATGTPGAAEGPVALSPATTLVDRYRVRRSIGAGGMGEVYEAVDKVLERPVAIKVLPAWLAASSERQERFSREARNLARLSHPHICAIHDAGVHDGLPFIVMELLSGETLSSRLSRAPLSVRETIDIGIQVAEALAYAHRQGVVHRDLKPGNVMMLAAATRAEQLQVKLLDFGLAKVRAPERSEARTATAAPSDSLSLTATGDIIGTVHYMAPEQLEGQAVDARTDVFALGVLLYEMVTGARPFTGASRASIVASILRDRPLPLGARSVVAPPALDRIIGSCLSKSPDERWQSAQDVATALRAISTTDDARPLPDLVPAPPRRRSWMQLAAVVALLVGLGALAGWGLWSRAQPAESVSHAMLRVGLSFPSEALGPYWGPVLSPDGRHVAFVAAMPGGPPRIWLRALDDSMSRPLPGTDGTLRLFWSPRSDQIGFFAEGELRRVSLSGTVERIASVPTTLWGGSWNAKDEILLSGGPGHGLFLVPATGGALRALMEPEVARGEQGLLWPAFMPDGESFVYTVESSDADVRGIYIASLKAPHGKRLTDTWSPAAYAPEGFLVYARDQALVAHKLDRRWTQLEGEPVVLGERATSARWGFFSAARGVVAFLSADTSTRLTWLDRMGREVGRLGDDAKIAAPVIAPDGRHVAVHRTDEDTGADDIWVFDPARGTGIRLAHSRESDSDPVWSPDGRLVAFSRDGLAIYQAPASGSGEPRLMLRTRGGEIYPNDWAPDNSAIIYSDFSTSWADLWLLPLRPGGEPVPFRRTLFTEHQARFSPDSRWVAYTSDESGRPEVYLQALPPSTARLVASIDGGAQPMWRGDGKELYYLGLDGQLYAVQARLEDGKAALGAPQPLFRIRTEPSSLLNVRNEYTVLPDGSRFLVSAPTAGVAPEFSLVFNWSGDRRRPGP
jgi:serine/threonine protein kinase